MEWVPHKVCTGDTELRSFYCNAGRITAILYLLGCTDCHHENLIACGDQLLLIDAETLFEGVPNDHTKDRNSFGLESGLQTLIDKSIIRSGLLPQWHFIGQQPVPRDVSALGIQPPQCHSRQAVGWIALNSDGMISGMVEQPVHIPTLLAGGFWQSE
jgi:lantibiotic modifying enzyme